ncbi:MAG: 2-C-methyl-D-erythritol 2,4-cyclodiphosphate synthase [Balneolaceae bacterium]|nr:MAG: 2-C-methyl-D-erythritol 2,4-cyclodiphosphate synthase [Balneolaceae bacterium]
MSFRIGQGYDIHRLAEGRDLILGGILIPHSKGLLGHSDADVLLHAITDALLGALSLGDIGTHFPDTDPLYEGADSIELLKRSYDLVQAKGYQLVNADTTIIAERPKIKPNIIQIRERIASALDIEIEAVSVKATTGEKMGFIGREEGIAAQAIVLLEAK